MNRMSRGGVAKALLVCGAAMLGAWACGDGGKSSSVAPEVPGGDLGGDEGAEPAAPEATGDMPTMTVFRPRRPVDEVAETRLTRLTHTQYLHTMQDLFGVSDSLDLTFAPDALNGFTFDTSNDFRVDARLGPQYRASAEKMAERSVTDAAVFAHVVPCDAAAPGCRDQFLSTFGERAFRRPLAADELTSFQGLFELGADLVQSGDAFKDGVRLSVEAFLQSPQFLYRTDASSSANGEGRIPLGDWEIASRLSYFLYDSMPDAELFEAARSGQLRTPEQVEDQARRMLNAPRVLDKLVSFHEQAWAFGRFSRISPDKATYPNVPGNFIARALRAAELYVGEVLGTGGGLEELLTGSYAFVDDGLAPLYGLQAPASGFQRVEFAGGERRGLLMQVGFLASNAYSIRTDPIHRGLFVQRNVLCRAIPDPPPGASTTPLPPTDEPIETTREEIGLLTGQSYCPTCHGQINPPGFAFEGFDAIGQVRATENGVPVDTSATMVLDDHSVSFSGPGELVELLASSQEAHRCYASRWIEFTLGRPLAEADVPIYDAIGTESLPVADIVAKLVTSPQFLTLSGNVADVAGTPQESP
jgi:uncharacterized protein DUF1592/uncharacterized protein DUF1588/uncharacterized protein DUF1595/uncharacterized protein DUF1585/uncharacterized protein DUF1587